MTLAYYGLDCAECKNNSDSLDNLKLLAIEYRKKE